MSLSDEIYNDYDRPIASEAVWSGDLLLLRGFNIANEFAQLYAEWTDSAQTMYNVTAAPQSFDTEWGIANSRPYLMGESVFALGSLLSPEPASGTWIKLLVTNTETEKQTTHPLWIEY